MEKHLIQANNLDTVIDLFLFVYNHPGSTKEEMSQYCGFSLRQVDYYLNACLYLGLLDENGFPTELANSIVRENKAQVAERIYELIILDELFGKVFARMFVLPQSNVEEYAMDLVKHLYPGYSDAVYTRRRDNIILWCKKILKEMKRG